MKPRRSTGAFQSLLCPVDFSAGSQRALRYAEVVLRRHPSRQARLTVLHVSDPLLVAAAAAAYPHADVFAGQTLKELRRFVGASLSADLMNSGRVDCAVTEGDPAAKIVAAASRRKADLIVIATQGLGGIKRWIVGSTTRRVLADAPVPVLVVPGSKRMAGPVPATWPGGRALLALDLSNGRQAIADAASALYGKLGTRLTLVHILPPVQYPPWAGSRLAGVERTRAAKARAALQRVAKSLGPTLTARCVIGHGDPTHEIGALATKLGVGLLAVIHRRGHGRFGRPVGMTAYEIMRQARVPVLSFPVRRR